ncbi:dual oxidase maturation factor 1-like [Eriocheir sinensis]|uniref:dual oxidase maturation factor 1-like n=1 Tax=Eriocheir sinensis TaxID=95602 RepID=UPI0021C99B9F|nr:dual oxidase maturation factor 1-like [Eriocheir sinensis]
MASFETKPTTTTADEEEGWSSGLFSAFRNKPFPSIFPPHATPVTCDVLYVGMMCGFIVIFVSFLSIFPTFMGAKDKAKVFSRVVCGLTLGTVIMACNFGQEWEIGSIRTHTPYRAGSGQGIYADVGLRLGLRSVNITLKAVEAPRGHLAGEKINYNERFSWAWGQGNPGFGPQAGAIQRAYRAAQVRGAPLPILWVAEYFTIDGEGLRFGRHYRLAGWYAHICVWTAFPLWILTLILFKMVVRLGAQALTLTGTMLTCASLIWAFNRNPIELQIPFEAGILKTHFGIHWYLSLVVGVLCMVSGMTIYLIDYHFPGTLSSVFGNNPLSIVEQETTEEEQPQASDEPGTSKRMSMQAAGRCVVTTLRLVGSKRQLKRVTDYPQDLRASQSTDSLARVEEDDDDEEGTETQTEGEPLRPVQSLLTCPASYKHGEVMIHLDDEGTTASTSQPTTGNDNPAYDGGDGDGDKVVLRK